MSRQLGSQGLALIGPFERLCHCAVVVFNESQYLSFEILDGSKVASFDDLAHQDTEPNFDLVHPGSMFGCVMKDNAMRWLTQEFRS